MEFRPNADSVSVWIVSHPAGLAVDENGLSADEIARARRLALPGRRNAFVATRRALRHILAGCTGGKAEELEFAYSAEGKPSLSGHLKFAFSVSHATDLSLVAVGRDIEIGIDVEDARQQVDFLDLATRFFPAAEAAAITAAAPDDGLAAFLTAWTRKEAMAKAAGDGIAEALGTPVSMLCPESGPIRHRSRDGIVRGWFLRPLDIAPDHIAAIAMSRPVEQAGLRAFGYGEPGARR